MVDILVKDVIMVLVDVMVQVMEKKPKHVVVIYILVNLVTVKRLNPVVVVFIRVNQGMV